jgi:hypothetical protein
MEDPKYTRRALLWAVGFTLFAVLCRQAPYYPPFKGTDLVWHLMPVGALSLFVGSRLRSGWAFMVPLAAMLLSDLLLIAPLTALGQPALGWGRLPVYGCFLLTVLIGRWLSRDESSPSVIGGATLLGSLQFFVLTNLSVWVSGGGLGRPHTPAGLAQCYLDALPFFGNSVLGDLAFTALFFTLHAVTERALARRGATALGRQPA